MEGTVLAPSLGARHAASRPGIAGLSTLIYDADVITLEEIARKPRREVAALNGVGRVSLARLDIWMPHEPVQAPAEVPTFHEFASQWLDGRMGELRPRTIADYEWALSYQLLPMFSEHRLSAITVAEVDRYKAAKLAEGKLGASQINKTLKLLAQILDMAIEYQLVDRANPARGRRRVKRRSLSGRGSSPSSSLPCSKPRAQRTGRSSPCWPARGCEWGRPWRSTGAA